MLAERSRRHGLPISHIRRKLAASVIRNVLVSNLLLFCLFFNLSTLSFANVLGKNDIQSVADLEKQLSRVGKDLASQAVGSPSQQKCLIIIADDLLSLSYQILATHALVSISSFMTLTLDEQTSLGYTKDF